MGSSTHTHAFFSCRDFIADFGKLPLGAFTNRNGQEWTSITGTDLKIHPKIHVLSVLDKKFWLSKISKIFGVQTVSMQKMFSKIFSVLP